MVEKNEAEIYGLAYGGRGVARIDGKVCFVAGALPGEKVRFIKEKDSKKFVLGRATEILVASSDRVAPPCPYYSKCGGCQYQHLNCNMEAHYKAEQVKEALERIGGFKEYEFEGITPSPRSYNYRSTITLHRFQDGYGYFANDNKTGIVIDRCLLAEEPINRAIGALDISGGKKDITMKCDKAGNAYINGSPGHRFFKDDFLGTELTFSPAAFSQANRQIASAIAEKLRILTQTQERETLFDLYCGVGFFGILMRDLFKTIIGVDESRDAIDCAKTTKRDCNIANIGFHCGEADNSFPLYYDKFRGKVNTILIDPPRSGISKKIAGWLSGLKNAGYLYYISCDPSILARDAKLLTQNQAWTLERVACFDMFPQTKHIESIALFKNKM